MSVKLIYAVLHLGKSKLDVVVEDAHGHRRKLVTSWMSKDQTDVPPTEWLNALAGEIKWQDAQQHAIQTGRIIEIPKNPPKK